MMAALVITVLGALGIVAVCTSVRCLVDIHESPNVRGNDFGRCPLCGNLISRRAGSWRWRKVRAE